MNKISSFTLANNGGFMVKIHITAIHANGKGDSFTSDSFSKYNTKTVYLKDCKSFQEGDIVQLEAHVVGGRNRKAKDSFIFSRTANTNAKYSVKGTTLIIKDSLKFEGLEALEVIRNDPENDIMPTDPIEKALYIFEKSSVAGCWDKISKKDVIQGIRNIFWGTAESARGINITFDKVMDDTSKYQDVKDNIIQGQYPICGATAIMYDFVHKKPEKFVKCMQDLYEKGSFEAVKGHKITAGKKLRSYEVNYDKYIDKDRNSSCVCWMLQATICQNMNKVFKDINPKFPIGSVTMSTLYSGIKKMCTDLLGYRHVSFKSADRASYIKDTLKPLWLDALKKKGTVFMLYSSSDLENNTKKFNASNWHWVPCYDFKFDDENLSIVYHSWNKMKRIKTLSIEEFSIYYSSCVIAY